MFENFRLISQKADFQPGIPWQLKEDNSDAWHEAVRQASKAASVGKE